jgi:hypothetical protein
MVELCLLWDDQRSLPDLPVGCKEERGGRLGNGAVKVDTPMPKSSIPAGLRLAATAGGSG